MEALCAPELGPRTLRALLRHYGSWSAARRGPAAEWKSLGAGAAAHRAVRDGAAARAAETELRKAAEAGVKLVQYGDEGFPPALRLHDDLPPLLYVKGDLLAQDAVAVALVGSRRASVYGAMHAERFAFELAQAGFTVVSGLAQGIDAAAHRGALKGRGRTLAVLGNGLPGIYPPENEDLAAQVAAAGAVISELPMGTAPAKANFPVRNRIIAGLSLGVVVVEADRQSGALITARLAYEMGKEVFAVPGDIGRPQTRGPHRLIRDGATLVESVQDILDPLGAVAGNLKVAETGESIPDPRALQLNPVERKVYDLLDSVPKDIDALTRESGLSAANTASTLLVLELRKMAVQMPGKLYVRPGTLQR
jgi:DNA processing protein